MKNVKDIKTTIIGSILFLVGVAFFSVNFKTLDELTVNQCYVPAGLIGFGIIFILAPDTILDIIANFIKKYVGGGGSTPNPPPPTP